MKSLKVKNHEKYRIILADDHPVFRAGLKNLIEQVEDLIVVDEANNGKILIEKVGKKPCDMVILDLSMPEMDGLEALDRIRIDFPDIKVLIVSMHKEREHFKSAIAKDVDGYVLKDDVIDKIIFAIKQIRSGGKSFSLELLSLVVKDYSVLLEAPISIKLLTRREREVLKLIVKGMTSKEVAEKLSISKRTVDVHRTNIMQKLQVDNLAELIKFSISTGLSW